MPRESATARTTASDSTRAVRDTARGSKDRTKPAVTKALFQGAAKRLVRRQEDEGPAARRRRRGETGRAFARLGRKILRRTVQLPPQAFAAATFLADTLEWLNYWQVEQGADSNPEETINATYEHLFPHL